MLKIIPPDSYRFDHEPSGIVKVSRRGLRGNDYSDFVKTAGDELASMLKSAKLYPDETLVHNIALGSTERFGPNRRGDGFDHEALRRNHKTFEKHARLYRDHKNTDPSKSYGIVKLAWFNEPMSRVELVIGVNATKAAADRNGGLVGDEEMELISSGKMFPTSMAFREPYDICSSCNNKAKTRADYCTGVDEGGHCKHGGLKNRIGRVCSDGHVLHAMNPRGYFCDISRVWRGADPTSYVLGRFDTEKAASMSGAELGEALCGVDPVDDTPEWLFEHRDSLEFLKLAEDDVFRHPAAPLNLGLNLGMLPFTTGDNILGRMGHRQKSAWCIDTGIMPTFDDYMRILPKMQREGVDSSAVKGELSSIFSNVKYSSAIQSHLRSVASMKTDLTPESAPVSVKKAFSLLESYLQPRVRELLVRGAVVPKLSVVKLASASTLNEQSAAALSSYAAFQAMWLTEVSRNQSYEQKRREAEKVARLNVLQRGF